MRAFDSYHDPFAFESLLSLPALSAHQSSAWRALDLDEHRVQRVLWQDDAAKSQGLQDLHSEFFHLQTFDVPLPEIESASVSSAPSDVDDIPATSDVAKRDVCEDDDDIWTLHDVIRPGTSNVLTSWDRFLQPSHGEPEATHLSEAGPAAFDAFLGKGLIQIGKHFPSKIARPDKFIVALFELGCGRESGFFRWQKWKKTFERRTSDFGLLGTSQDVQDALIESFNTTGSTIRYMIDFTEEIAVPSESQELLIALSSAISVAIYAVMQFVEQERHTVQTLPRLHDLFHRPQLLIEGLVTLVKMARSGAKSSEIIVDIINEAQQLGSGTVWLEDILSETIIRAATPWLNDLAYFIGLSPPTSREFAMPLSTWALKYEGNTMVGWLPPEMSSLVMECETSLQLLQAHEPDHPLLTNTQADRWPSLSWECSWEAIEKLQSQADDYERKLKNAIRNFTQGLMDPDWEADTATGISSNGSHVSQDPDIGLVDLDSSTRWNKHLGRQERIEDDKLDQLVSQALSTEVACSVALAPPLDQTVTLSVVPLLKAQHRLLSYSVLHLLFKGHAFRLHLELHQQFQLLGDGSFASRLSQALFDPDQSSGEGRRKGQGKTGLRLQTREKWPPASSELRLVLTGILAESFAAEHAGTSKAENQNLSDAMSFAIRDLSDVELDKCRDANSIYALDFLRLQYKPPSALLEAVLTSSSQKKYDHIFKHLLRVLRVRSVTLSLIRSVSGRNCKSATRSDHKFRVEIQFFVSTLAEYSANVAIRVAWNRLDGLVQNVERCLNNSDFDGAIAVAGSLRGLTAMHDEALDCMLRALCLDKKQAQARALLEDIFGLILKVAAMTRNDDTTSNDRNEEVQALYKKFRKQVGRFTRYLQAQSDASTSAGGGGNGEALAFGQLLVRLNMFGYYS